jgi:hypothetical protein
MDCRQMHGRVDGYADTPLQTCHIPTEFMKAFVRDLFSQHSWKRLKFLVRYAVSTGKQLPCFRTACCLLFQGQKLIKIIVFAVLSSVVYNVSTFLPNFNTKMHFFSSRTMHLAIIKVSYLLVPTDAQKFCSKRNINIYIKHFPTCFGLITIITERAIWAFLKLPLLKQSVLTTVTLAKLK